MPPVPTGAAATPAALYVLRPPEAPGQGPATRFQPVEPRWAAATRCAGCGGEETAPAWQPPYRVTLSPSGATAGDVAFGPGTELLVSAAFARRWKTAGLRGLSGFEPVTVEPTPAPAGAAGARAELLHVRVAHSEARLDEKESEVERTGGRPCEVCGAGGVLKHFRRLALRPEPRPTDDLFIARGLTTAVLAGARFEQALGHAGLTGFLLVRADQLRAL